MVIELTRWKGKVAVVTGAGAGIGAAISEQLVKAGLKVVGVDRREDKVEELAKKLSGKDSKLYGYNADVGVEEEVVKVFKWVTDNVGPTSILVNNAGVARPTTLIDGDAAEWKRILDTNVMGLSLCTREAIKHMKDNEIDGHIININSIQGHIITNRVGLNMYAPSKHAVTALTETLRHELNAIGSKIKVTSISPARVKTELVQANNLAQHYAAKNKNLKANVLSNHIKTLEGTDIADAALYILSTPPHVLINELTVCAVGEQW